MKTEAEVKKLLRDLEDQSEHYVNLILGDAKRGETVNNISFMSNYGRIEYQKEALEWVLGMQDE